MTPPVQVACDALVGDADKWKAASDAMAGAARAAGNLAMNEGQFGQWAERRGVIRAYLALQQKFTALAQGASAEFDAISTTLREVARTYLAEDEAGAHDMRRIEEHL
ncbi:MAG TPA: hypothetical protein VFV67_33820 [Actinophytocola sp.]|uniref:hypothetical protein n=1 Tax=Actinophytocola sp. TaxID=1872138 RepID=UPI002DB84702|nr:hypothetical protein [Actinophytocola sp.]HEU5475648.1 hypothetical protein [Actinophytocola sp.]